MAQKIRKYTNPFIKAKAPLIGPDVSAIPNINDAIALHKQGELDKAELIYRQIIGVDPRDSDAIHLLGVVAMQKGDFQVSVDLITKAIEINKNVPSYHSNLGNVLQEIKQFDAAIASYDAAIELKPDLVEAYYNRGNAQKELKQFNAAVANYDKVIAHLPDFAGAYFNRGLSLQELKQFDAAVASYDKTIELKPNLSEAYSNRGNALKDLKQLEAAIASYDRAIFLKPDMAEAYYNRALSLHELKNLEAAVASYDKAIELKPDLAEAYYSRGLSLHELKQLDAAIENYEKAIYLKPNYPQAYLNRGNALKELKHLDAAVASYDKAIELDLGLAEAYSNRGNALQELKQFDAAIACYDKAIVLRPDYAEAYSNRGNVQLELNQSSAAITSYDKAIAINPNLAEAYYNRGSALQKIKQFDAAVVSYGQAIALKPDYDYLLGIRQHARMFICDWQNFNNAVLELSHKIQNSKKASTCLAVLALPSKLSEQRKVAETWCADKHPFKPSLGPIIKSKKQSKIRIGYYSADFHNHATTQLMAELFEKHDKCHFELIGFSFGPNKIDAMRERVTQAFDQFIDVTSISDESVALMSRELGIDIAVDLKGLTQDARLGIFAYRVAPIQVSYLGYPGTLGVDYIDYLIADKTLIPVQSQQHYSEKIVYLPHSYQVNDRKRDIAPVLFTKEELGLPQESFVFCCFNNNYKITPDVFDTWCRILKAVKNSVLWLLEDNPMAAVNLRKEAQLRGVEPNRLVFAKRMNLPEHLARHKAADLFLDTLHYNAHTTASDALWVGLPVLTCLGEGFASRVAGSLLNAIGLPELITTTQNDYEALAIELATHPDKLKAIKDRLNNNRLTTPLFDTPSFVKHIESAYTKMYERYQADLMADHIEIDDADKN
jgi:predicted O-linked N-acetylglucosamine transferase (SPINDLY family)